MIGYGRSHGCTVARAYLTRRLLPFPGLLPAKRSRRSIRVGGNFWLVRDPDPDLPTKPPVSFLTSTASLTTGRTLHLRLGRRSIRICSSTLASSQRKQSLSWARYWAIIFRVPFLVCRYIEMSAFTGAHGFKVGVPF